ncbi:hypothetical protein [Myroides fluvii]|uniref:hypothetical protein n=1 Tax=Myroides fluvii TaxID=2572594 RepID=UPI00131A8CB8|nr:hypothetical protein [Myroides fluvii]
MSRKKQILKHSAKSFLLAFILAVVYFILGNALLKGAYAELFHFFVAVGLFIGSVVFYFLFIYFKSIKKLKWLFGGLAIYLAITGIASTNLDLYFINLFTSNKLPKQYLDYQEINEPLLHFKNKEMSLLMEGDVPLNPYLTPERHLILTKAKFEGADREQRLKKEFYKFDTYGNLLALYKSSTEDELFFEGYIINLEESYYKTWALDGDTLKRKIEIHNADFNFDSQKQIEFIGNIEKKATFFFAENYYSLADGTYKIFEKVVFWQDNTWNILFNDTKAYRGIQKKVSNELFRSYSTDKYEWVVNENPTIQYQYFQKIKLEENDLWRGFLYTTVRIDQDTLKIKEALSMSDTWKNDQVKINNKLVGNLYRAGQSDFLPYLYYAHSSLHYQLFSNDLRKLYLIKNK